MKMTLNDKRETMNPTLDDSDLEELISSSPTPNNDNNNRTSDKSSDKTSKMSNYFQPNYESPTSASASVLSQVPTLLSYMCMSFMLQYPRLAKLTTFLLLALVLSFFFVGILDNRSKTEIGVVKYDFTKVKSQYDFQIGNVDHWCIDVSLRNHSFSLSTLLFLST